MKGREKHRERERERERDVRDGEQATPTML